MISYMKNLFQREKQMNWTQIAENYWVSPQISEQDVETLVNEGFDVIMCNRPDHESADQTDSAVIQAATEAKGLEFLFLPMNGPNFTDEYIQKVQQLNAENKKVFAYCRSGNRSAILFNAANS